MSGYHSIDDKNYVKWIEVWVDLIRYSHEWSFEWSFIEQMREELLDLRYIWDALPDILVNEELSESMLKSPCSMKRT